MKTKRLEFDKPTKAKLYAREKAICASCGTDLWRFRLGICPFLEMDWADHILPAAKGGGNSFENGACICSACNTTKGDNTRDKHYSYLGGVPSGSYLKRFDQVNPLVEATINANQDIHWTDWYFNRAICNMDFGVTELRLAMTGRQKYARDAAHYARVTWNFVREWQKFSKSESVVHPTGRGLAPTVLEGDHHLILRMFEAESEQDVADLQGKLVPYLEGHLIFYTLKTHAYGDVAIAKALIRELTSPDGLWQVLNAAELIGHPIQDKLVDAHLAARDGDKVVPHPMMSKPILSTGRTVRLTESLARYHRVPTIGEAGAECLVVPSIG